MNDFVELRRYITVVIRWWWLIIVAVAVTSAIGYEVSRRQPRVYQASTTLVVGQSIQIANLERRDIEASQLVAQTFADIVRRQPVLQGAVERLSLNETWQALRRRVQGNLVEGTQLLEISVEADSPGEAEIIADEIAHQLILQSPTSQQIPETDARLEFVRQRLESLEANIEAGQSKLVNLEATMAAASSIETKQELQGQIVAMERLIADWQTSYTQLLLFSEDRQMPNYLAVVEAAQAAPTPIRPRILLNTLLAGAVGLFLALLVAFAFEHLNDAVKSAEDWVQVAGAPVLGSIASYKTPRGAGRRRLIVQAQPRSRAAENYRVLATTKLLFSKSGDRSSHVVLLRSLLISTSQVDNDIGEVEVAANLAVTLTQTGSQVILVDANLRRPTLGQLFGIVERGGLTDVLTGRSALPELVSVDWAPGLSILPTGPVASDDPFELLASPRAVSLVQQLSSQADLVIILASPVLSFADSLILASSVDGVMLVERSGATRRKDASNAAQRLHALGADIVGAILQEGRHRSAFGARRGKTVRKAAGSVVAGLRSLSAHLAGAVLDSLRRLGARSGQVRTVKR
ncbi:MAG TPA: Wzz/FepE/Etk N-terminal domain-containing protein [Pyrinomonadaceae bacterium]|nr:Wzz/FepE/Etk N-terminal domain-containing protein [Pyrinomonadaceae bacterium]